MITFLDEKDVEHGALATIKVTNAVNGERSLTGEIESGDYVLSNIERGWRLRFEDEFYVVTYAKPIDDGKTTHVTFDAVHQFFWDFDKSSVHEQLNDGSHTFLTYLDFIFTGSDYTYTIDPLLKVYAFEKQSFGYKSRLKLFNDVITSSGVEFQVNGKVVRILEKTGTDLSTVVRKNFNMNELGIEKNIGDFVTYQKGFGAWIDENDHSKGRLVTEYTSPLASVYGKLEAEPLVDERYTQADNMIAALKANVDNSYSISVHLDMEDLTRAGYDYTQPRAGDYIMAINETLDFQEKIRIVSFTSEYDVTGQLVKHEVICNDIGVVKKLSASYNLTKEQAQNASDSVGKAVEMANKALVSADGKSTVYFGNEFPKDEPKGTLHKGDSLYLTVGDTTKMYYWTGADWEELPIVNDVEAFKEQIADELKDVPNREEFEATITEKLATSKSEIKTQIDTAKTQAESNAKAYADEINQATAEVAEQANTAVNSLKSDLAKVKTDLTATTSTANDAKTSASEAKQQLTAVANDLSKAKQDLTSQAQQLQAQASTQSELTKRVSTVEETANGTKTTVSELSKTVDSNTKNITSVTARTKVVEDDLTSTKTTLSQVKTTADNTSKKTATLETGLNGVKADLTATTTTANTAKTNLANYQASNDKLVANLQSNLQTTNGNVSRLKTKIETVPGQISSAISTVEGKLEAIDQLNLIGAFNLTPENATFDKTDYTFTSTTTANTEDRYVQLQFYDANNVLFTGFELSEKVGKFAKTFKITKAYERFCIKINGNVSDAFVWCYDKDVIKLNTYYTLSGEILSLSVDGKGNGGQVKHLKLQEGKLATGFSKAHQDVDSDISKVTSEFKQTTDSIKASVSALDSSTVKTASLTINTDGIVMKAGKSTTDVANAIGSYFAVNQNAINLFSDKINVKGNMIVSGAITSDKIASKSITTAHLNGKIITADVISSNAVTADALKAGAVTTDKMSANSINGDRITAGTLDAAKIKAGSITASQIASGTITSSQIKTGGISAANIAAGAITTDKIAANSINSSKIVSSGITANVIKGGKLQSLSNATNFELDTGKLFYNNNNTGIFRVQANASTMGLKFSNTSITVSGTSRILSRVILGGDRRETTLDDGKWDQGGFSGIVVETINGIAANDHERADSLRVIADNIYFGHSYNKDVVTNTSAAGWKMETFSPNSTYTGHVVMKPFGINSRYADIVTGDVRLDNGDGSGYWVRGCIQVLRNCFQHFLNGGTSNDAKNAIRNALKDISGV
ncbi:phage tail protein [Streptococcus gallolyticus]|uniref:phage tail protein n=1 Tax=Streptococcus gallolyticus TaxID=315405 RepID=UPI001F068DB0|nr:phage tail protein [Streptococcus gallolyticus]MCH1618533.1 phage tail protein [Streptococcus gallolyticus]